MRSINLFDLILIPKLSLYFHTLRHLKPNQIFWRIWYKFSSSHFRASSQLNLRKISGNWVLPAQRRPSLENSNTFHFLNKFGSLSGVGWNGPEKEKLWRYNQHYFDDLNAMGAGMRTDWHRLLIEDWIKENPPGNGVGWEPYPTSLRIVNWVKWHLSRESLDDESLRSLIIQTQFLSQRIEWHILGNHLFANAKALVFSGVLFDGGEAQKWLNQGLSIISKELTEQVLPDGGNFERSPMYHAIFLEDLLDLINLGVAYPEIINAEQVNGWRLTAIKMLTWLEEMCHPDGEISFFNDAAIGVSPSPEEIKIYARHLNIYLHKLFKITDKPIATQFTNSGYVRLDVKDAVAILDVAPVGPDYLPGHAHADTLSFELSLFGKRIIVNGGTSQYEVGDVRMEERGTKAHNTVVIDNENSSEVWSSFRVARRAYPSGLKVSQKDNFVVVTCAHNGYLRLKRPAVHKRTWEFYQESLLVRDLIDGEFNSATALFHFHPDVEVDQIDSLNYSLCLPGIRKKIQLKVISGEAQLEKSFYAPEFGLRLERECLSIHINVGGESALLISWGVRD